MLLLYITARFQVNTLLSGKLPTLTVLVETPNRPAGEREARAAEEMLEPIYVPRWNEGGS